MDEEKWNMERGSIYHTSSDELNAKGDKTTTTTPINEEFKKKISTEIPSLKRTITYPLRASGVAELN